MSAPAGKCPFCGGPQQWSFIENELYVRCTLGCLPLPFETEVPRSEETSAAGSGMECASEVREGREAEASEVHSRIISGRKPDSMQFAVGGSDGESS